MRPDFQARHWDYVMGGPILQTPLWPGLATVAANAQIKKLSLKTDTDAAFLLRSIAARVQYDTTSALHRQTGLNQLLFRFSGPNENYFQQLETPLTLQTPWGGQMGNPLPLHRQVFYPAGSTIFVDLINNGSNTLTNLTFYFRGVKLFPWGVRRFYPYPKNMHTIPFTYIVGQSPPIGATTLYNVPITTGNVGFRYPWQVKSDGDFVLRTIQAGPTASNLSWEVFIRLKDSDDYPYSSDFIHLDTLAGNGTGPASFPTASGGTTVFQNAIGIGPSVPGVFFPEIYIPNQQYLQIEIFRADSGQGTASAQDFPMAFMGAKVFAQAQAA
jgi:hypothetical protein